MKFTFLLSGLVFSGLTLTAQPAAPIDLGSRLELLVDRQLADSVRGLAWKLHAPVDKGIALALDAPWEGNVSGYVTVLRAPDGYRMYYRGLGITDGKVRDRDTQPHTCLAESDDGILWRKPELGLVSFNGSRKNNIVMGADGDRHPAHNLSVMYDPRPDVPADERYKAIGGMSGVFGYKSADGRAWQPIQSTALVTKGPFDTQNTVFWDATRKLYFMYLRMTFPRTGGTERIRAIRVATSPDFRTWSEPKRIDLGESPEEHLYTNAITPYFRAPHHFLGFPMRFVPSRMAELPATYDTARVTGTSDSVLMTSRDGSRWERLFLEGYIRPGIGNENWTDRANQVAWGVVPITEEEMSVYVMEHYRLPTIRMRRFAIRTDGFISLNAPHAGGEMVTKPIRFTGRKLVVNYATSAVGSLRVELQDAAGQPIDGFDLGSATEHFGNSIQQVIGWRGGQDVGRLAGKPVRMRFVMKDADLFSFRFLD